MPPERASLLSKPVTSSPCQQCTEIQVSFKASIAFSVSNNGTVTGNVVLHSITDEHLRTDYLADIRTAEAHADAYQAAAEGFKFDAEAWAKGQRNGVDVTSQEAGYLDNSKYYKQNFVEK